MEQSGKSIKIEKNDNLHHRVLVNKTWQAMEAELLRKIFIRKINDV